MILTAAILAASMHASIVRHGPPPTPVATVQPQPVQQAPRTWMPVVPSGPTPEEECAAFRVWYPAWKASLLCGMLGVHP